MVVRVRSRRGSRPGIGVDNVIKCHFRILRSAIRHEGWVREGTRAAREIRHSNVLGEKPGPSRARRVARVNVNGVHDSSRKRRRGH